LLDGWVALVMGCETELGFGIFNGDEGFGFASAVAQDVGSGSVVGYAIDPGAKGAAVVESGEAAPEGEVHLLKQVLAGIGVGLPGARHADDRGAVCFNGIAIESVLRGLASGHGVSCLSV